MLQKSRSQKAAENLDEETEAPTHRHVGVDTSFDNCQSATGTLQGAISSPKCKMTVSDSRKPSA